VLGKSWRSCQPVSDFSLACTCGIKFLYGSLLLEILWYSTSVQVSNVAIIVLSVYDSFECFNLGSSLIEVVYVV
jgi:hypothetical protein